MNNGNITRLVLRAGMRAAAGIALVAAAPALAVTTVDQTNYVTGSENIDNFNYAVYYQTFTAGLTGSLAQIFLQISKASTTTLAVDIYKARGFGSTTELYGDSIGTGTFVRDAFGLLTYNTNAFVLAGQYYGVTVKFISSCTCTSIFRTPWAYNSGQYDGGNAGAIDVDFPNNRGNASNYNFDFGFTTVVDRDVAPPPSAVPEPATWGMTILGMGAVGFVMRRRRTITTRVSYVV